MQNIRNIAIIAHVDHGKTTLVDKIIHATNIFRKSDESGDLIMDNNDLERERGITILSKNISVTYKDTKINVIQRLPHQHRRYSRARRFWGRSGKSFENGRRGCSLGRCIRGANATDKIRASKSLRIRVETNSGYQ